MFPKLMGKHLITAKITDKYGRLIAQACNNYSKTHPIQAKFADSCGQPTRIFLHAEIAALLKLRPHDKPYKISVSRFYKDGRPANAKPCAVCEAAIKHWKISRVEHTI